MMEALAFVAWFVALWIMGTAIGQRRENERVRSLVSVGIFADLGLIEQDRRCRRVARMSNVLTAGVLATCLTVGLFLAWILA